MAAPVFRQYVASCYFIAATVTTVGYGDFSASTEAEMLFCSALMLAGVVAFSLAIGTFTSLL